MLQGPNKDLQSNPRAALWRLRNYGGTWTLLETVFYILFPAKGIVSYRQIISSRLNVRLKVKTYPDLLGGYPGIFLLTTGY